jgi:hypothetical protein
LIITPQVLDPTLADLLASSPEEELENRVGLNRISLTEEQAMARSATAAIAMSGQTL